VHQRLASEGLIPDGADERDLVAEGLVDRFFGNACSVRNLRDRGPGVLSGCQRPTEASDPTSVDDFVDASAPSAVNANTSTDGRTYRVARNNESDLIVPYQFKTSFSVTLTLNGNAGSSKYDLTFPVTLTQVTVKVNQASGGIVTPPTTGDPERSDYVVTQASGNKFTGANTSVTMNVDV
jgi:hypothetical protein